MDEVSPSGAILCHYCDSVVVTSGGGGGVTCNFTFNIVPGSSPTLVTCVSTVTAPAPYTVHWDFGNGMTTTGVAGTAQYFAPGVYTITMTVTDGMGNVLCSNVQTVVINPPASACSAYYVASMAGMTGAFIDLSSGISSNTTFTWSFGDGTASTARFPQHTYTVPGAYSVCLTIADTGCSDQYCTTVIADTNTVNPGPCQANFVTLQGAPYNVLVVNLSTGNNLNYFWDFGDGATSTQQYPSHFYSTTGSYVLCLTVNDGLLGCTSTFCDTLTVDSMGNVLRTTSTGFTVNVVSPSTLTGVSETPSDLSAVSVYPNPVTDRIIIAGVKESATYRILDLRGAMVSMGAIFAPETVLNAATLMPGSYMIEVIEPDGNRTFRRFIRQ
jgi:PKD repeat protein